MTNIFRKIKTSFCTLLCNVKDEDHKTIYFKNGMTTKITIQVAEIIMNRTIEGCGNFQSFTEQDGDIYLIVNISEIAYVA
jgi:hypothetical protein